MTDRIQKTLRKLSAKERRRIEQLVSCILCGDLIHMDMQKLQGRENVYRIRKGNLRIIFEKSRGHNRILAIERRGNTTYNAF